MTQHARRSGPVGRILRVVLGVVMLWWIRPAVDAGGSFLAGAILLAALLFVFYLAAHLALTRSDARPRHAVGVLLAAGPPVAVGVLGMPGGVLFGRGEGIVAALLYIGLSLLVMAARGARGCEVMVVPNLLLRREVSLPCLLFGPIDAWEDRRRRGVEGA